MAHAGQQTLYPGSVIHSDEFELDSIFDIPDLSSSLYGLHAANLIDSGSRLYDVGEDESDLDTLLYSDTAIGYEDVPSVSTGTTERIVDSIQVHIPDRQDYQGSAALVHPASFDDFMDEHQSAISGEFLGTDDLAILESDDLQKWRRLPDMKTSLTCPVRFYDGQLFCLPREDDSQELLTCPYMSTTLRSQEWVLESLELIASRLLRDLSYGRVPTVELSSRRQKKSIVYDEETGVIRRKQDLCHACEHKTCGGDSVAPLLSSFSKSCYYGTLRSGGVHSIFRAIELIHENVYNGTISTKRDLFYRDVALFKSQRVVDNIVENLACTLLVPRPCLNVVAGTRSMVFGSVRMILGARYQLTDSANGERDDSLTATSSQTAFNTLVIVPVMMEDVLEIEIHPKTRFVLVVEKEAVMEYLIASRFCHSHGPCILLTSKGYPDRVARQLLKYLSDMVQAGIHVLSQPSMSKSMLSSVTVRPQYGNPWADSPYHPLDTPLLALVDCDPHGLEIFLTFRCGSVQSAYDNANLAVPTLRCLGQLPTDWNSYLTSAEECVNVREEFERTMMPLTVRDRGKLVSMLKHHPYVRQSREWRRQVSKMLMMNRKTELESLYLDVACPKMNQEDQGRELALVQFLKRKLNDPCSWL
ncbi:endodeoxyribonuclease [Dissophora globulifera]|uniref:DNA topoisomerase (ATP-hydrolyzing) n=1 Tax=Dissophora globulifera TaxID=979702 RepID=A0A9P6RF48_9FUNG|nr:endodeoxyribonuclease [Dissophora globulifera]